MDTQLLTHRTLEELRTQRPYPAVSLTMPTHRQGGGIQDRQDQVRLRKLVVEAKRQVDADPNVSRQAGADVHQQLDRAVAEVDLRHAKDGLVIFADMADHQIWQLPREVPEDVVLGDSFLTRNLVAAHEQVRPYWVLAVSGDRATLWTGSGEDLETDGGHGFPLEAPQDERPDRERAERIGALPSGSRRRGDIPGASGDQQTRAFLRTVDAALAPVLQDDPRPLFLVGSPHVLGLLDETGTVARAASGRLAKGGLTDGPGHALSEALGPVIAADAASRDEQVTAQLDQAVGRRTFAAGVDEVWHSVQEARVGLLAVEEHYRQAVRVADEHLVPVSPQEEPASRGSLVRGDIVDDIVEQALETGSDVAFVPDGSLTAHGRIAAVLRH